MGRHRHDAARDALGAHHGFERHQYSLPRATPRSSGRIPRARRWRSTRCNCGIARSSASWAWPTCLRRLREATIEAAEQIFHHPKVALLCCTGGAAVAKAAAKSGKRVIAGGPGNPPVVVDETADLDRAARCIIEGAAFDNNLLCIGEKEVFVVASVADAFIAAMQRAGAYQLDAAAIDRLTKAAFTFEGGGGGCARAHVKKDLVGKDVAVLASGRGRAAFPPEPICSLARPTRIMRSLWKSR